MGVYLKRNLLVLGDGPRFLVQLEFNSLNQPEELEYNQLKGHPK